MICHDEHGAYLGTDTIRIPRTDCFFLLPPKFPYFDCKDYDPSGTNVCIDSDVVLEMTFRAQGFVGAQQLMPTTVESLHDDFSYILFDADASQPTVWAVSEDGNRLVRQPYALPLSPRAAWTAVRVGQAWQWRNEWAWKAIAQFADATPTTDIETATAFSTTAHPRPSTSTTTHTTWTLHHPTHATDASIIARRYRAKAYFNAQIEFRDASGQSLRPDSLLLAPAGEDLLLTLSPLDSRPLLHAKATAIDDAGETTEQTFSAEALAPQHFTLPHLSAHQQIVLTYGHPSAIVNAITTPADAPLYDLSGRPTRASGPGLYLRRGQRPLLR